MRQQLSGEAQDIARLIERRLAEVAWGDHSHALDQLEIQRAFLAHRFIGPMKMYERSLRGYSVLDNFLNLTSILAGVGASLAAALDAPKVYAIVLGLVVGLLQSISQWLKPSQRSTRRGLAAAYLRARHGRSSGTGPLPRQGRPHRMELLCDQVDRVEAREPAQQDQEAAQVHHIQWAALTERYSHHMPDATLASISRGPSSTAIAARSASVSCSRSDTLRRHAVGSRHRRGVEPREARAPEPR